MKIGALAVATATPPENIRFYERSGLLPEPSRSGNNYRAYGQEHVELLLLIRGCRAAGMALEEIRRVLQWSSYDARQDARDDAHLRGQAAQFIGQCLVQVQDRMEQLEFLRRHLQAVQVLHAESADAAADGDPLDASRGASSGTRARALADIDQPDAVAIRAEGGQETFVQRER